MMEGNVVKKNSSMGAINFIVIFDIVLPCPNLERIILELGIQIYHKCNILQCHNGSQIPFGIYGIFIT